MFPIPPNHGPLPYEMPFGIILACRGRFDYLEPFDLREGWDECGLFRKCYIEISADDPCEECMQRQREEAEEFDDEAIGGV